MYSCIKMSDGCVSYSCVFCVCGLPGIFKYKQLYFVFVVCQASWNITQNQSFEHLSIEWFFGENFYSLLTLFCIYQSLLQESKSFFGHMFTFHFEIYVSYNIFFYMFTPTMELVVFHLDSKAYWIFTSVWHSVLTLDPVLIVLLKYWVKNETMYF